MMENKKIYFRIHSERQNSKEKSKRESEDESVEV